jgi:hypothetical protein
LEVEYGRCYAVYLPGPVCVLWPTPRIHVWVKAEAGAVEIRAGDQIVKADAVEVGGGQRYRIVIPPGATSLAVSLRSPDGSQGASWSLALKELEIPAWEDGVDALIRSGKGREAQRRLIELRKTSPPKEQGLILQKLAVLARADADIAGAETYLKQGILADRAAGCWSGEAEKLAWLAGLYLDQGRFSAARQTLEALKLSPGIPAEAKYLKGF